jgi:NAD+-dependent protein deacetylase sirtuin 6
MSDGYAARLKHYPNKGVCGLPESIDSPRVFQMKLKRLKELLSSSSPRSSSSSSNEEDHGKKKKRIVVFTGAGISTSAGIPDFRGPRGIWTVEQIRQKTDQKKKRKRTRQNNNNDEKQQQQQQHKEEELTGRATTSNATAASTMDFATAAPTLTHRAITRLIVDGHVSFCITQNVDGLHRRSGLSRQHHAVLHGCVFTEQCQRCGGEYFRTREVGGST